MLKTSDLKVRDVINIIDGRRLGVMSDVEVDLESGRVTAIIVPGNPGMLRLFGRGTDYVIPWDKIVKVGVDVILVEMPSFADGPGSRSR